MAKKSPDTQNGAVLDAIIDAALALAAERGWRGLSLAEIAERAGIGLAALVEQAGSKAAILDAYGRRIDRRMLEGGAADDEAVRDRLFDVLMRRFEAMAPDRKALAVILRETGDDPWALACGARRFLGSLALTLECAGLSATGLAGLARLQGLGVVAAYAFKAFLDDQTEDLSPTMAALDKALRRAEDVAGMVWRRSPAAQPAEAGK